MLYVLFRDTRSQDKLYNVFIKSDKVCSATSILIVLVCYHFSVGYTAVPMYISEYSSVFTSVELAIAKMEFVRFPIEKLAQNIN